MKPTPPDQIPPSAFCHEVLQWLISVSLGVVPSRLRIGQTFAPTLNIENMAAYCFFDILEVIDPDKLGSYRNKVLSTVEHFSGRYLTVGGKCDVVEGDWRPAFPVLIEFPSLEQAHHWYDSEEYRELKALRFAATKCNAVFIEGTDFTR